MPFPGRPQYPFVTDEVYGTFTLAPFGCPWGWARTLRVADPSQPRVVDEYLLPENSCPAPSQADQARGSYSSHNPTLTRDLALVTWHSGGLQAIDIHNPNHLRQTDGSHPHHSPQSPTRTPPSPAAKVVMWSFPVINEGLIYVIDIRNGLYILRYTGRHARDMDATDFLEGNSNLGDARRLEG